MERAEKTRHGRRRALAAALVTGFTLLATAVALAAEGDLTFVEAEINGVDGADFLNGANALAVSPDGEQVYIASSVDDAVAVYGRDPGTGELSLLDAAVDGVDGVDGLDNPAGVAISPDGKNVYATALLDSAVVVFGRDPDTGLLTPVGLQPQTGENMLNQPVGIAVSPDGASVYVASQSSDALTECERLPANGDILCPDVQVDGLDGVDGLNGARGVAVAPDGENVYVTGANDNAVATFSRDPGTGALTFIEAEKDGVGGVDSLGTARDVEVSPDGRHVYVAAAGDDALTAFSRDSATGALSLVGALRDGVGGVDGLNGATSVVTSGDGKNIYVAASAGAALASFSRAPGTGAATFEDVAENGVDGVTGLATAFGVATTADGKGVYVAALAGDAVVAFAREPDVTAPDTTIDSGPGSATADPSPVFEFSSDDAGFTARFECAVDGGAFAACTSPETVGPLAIGPHDFAVRAVDTAGNADASPAVSNFEVIDDEVEGTAAAKRTQKQKGKRIRIKVRVEAGEDLDARLSGKLVAGRSTFKLAKTSKSVAAGKTRTVKLGLKKPKQSGAVLKSLKRGKRGKATIKAKLADEAGNRIAETLRVKLR